MMNLEEMEKAKGPRPVPDPGHQPSFREELKHEMEHVNWKLVIAIAFGFLMWYAGTAMLDNLLNTCSNNIPACKELP